MIVTLVALAAVAGAGAWMLFRPHRYQAVSQILVTPAPFADATYTGLPVLRDISADPTRAIQTAAAVVDSPTAAAAAARALGGNWTEAGVRSAVTVTPVGGTNVIAVQAAASNPSTAARLADAFATAALQGRAATLRAAALTLIEQLKSGPKPPGPATLDPLIAVSQGFDPSFSLLHTAAPPGSPSGPPAWRTLTVVLFAGVVLGIGAALLTDVALRRWRPDAPVVELAPRVSGQPSQRDAPAK
jgi:capsular polysaccharide biosynthesis protein